MDFAWFVIGMLTSACVMYCYYLYAVVGVAIRTLAVVALGMFLLLFACAWGAGSYLEGVPRAASMGFVFFGIPGCLLLLFGFKKIAKAD